MKRALAAGVLLLLGRPAAGASAPDWLAQVAREPYTPPSKEVPAVVLVAERELTVSADGDVVLRERRAVRCLAPSGNVHARAVVPYLTDTQKVKDFRGYLLRQEAIVRRYGKSEIVDVAASTKDVFNESRYQLLSAEDEAKAGDVFGAEWTVDGPSPFSQADWTFQGRLPALLSRFTVVLPVGWQVKAEEFGDQEIGAATEGPRTSWTLRNLRHLPAEPLSPPVTFLAPRISISWSPPSGQKGGTAAGGSVGFESWRDVSRWLWGLAEPRTVPDELVIARAKELTREAGTDLSRAEGLCRFVQKVTYVSVSLGLGRGGGYRPHFAGEVLRKGHGDCKDKATLLVSLLRAVGIRAHQIAVYAGDGAFVRRQWPSPQQFDHMIVGIELKDLPEGAPTVALGADDRLLLFDPTDDTVPFGDLPYDDRFGLGLLVHPEAGALVSMPGSPPGGFPTQHEVSAALEEDGAIVGRVEVRGAGPLAGRYRRLERSLTPAELTHGVEEWLASSLQAVQIEKTGITEVAPPGTVRLEAKLVARMPARTTAGGLFLFRPAFVPWVGLPSLPPGPRVLPALVPPYTFRASYEVRIPPSTVVDELPAPVRFSSPYGVVSAESRVEGGVLSVRQEITLNLLLVPAAEYESLRSFVGRLREAMGVVVVLKKRS